jgi:anti-sigma-K factor RskA
MNCEQVNELAGAYALGALSPEEVREVEEHLAGCNLHEEFASLRATASALSFAAPERDPPPALRARLLAAIEADAPAAPVTPVPIEGRRSAWRRRPYALAAALAIIAVGLLAWNLLLLSGNDEDEAIVRSVTSGSAAGTELRYLPDEQVAILDVEGLEELPEGRTYQIWTIRGDDAPRGVGLFQVNGSDRAVFTSPLVDGDRIAVTVEPAGGSVAPTTEPLFAITF